MEAQQIVSLACQIAKCPAYTSQAGIFLNNVLRDLAQHYDFDIIRKTYNFNFNPAAAGGGYAVGSGPFPMPADFLRLHRKGSFYTINGVPYPLIGVEESQFDSFVQQSGLASYPSMGFVDLSAMGTGGVANLFVWTPAAGAYPVTIRYNPQMPDIATPETSTDAPWFPNYTYLITAVAGELMKITNDDRLVAFLGEDQPLSAPTILRKYLIMKDDPETAGVKTVELDPRLFGRGNFNRLPNTKTVGW